MVGGTVYFRYWEWPDKERIELTKQRDIADLYIGDQATEITFRGGQPLDPRKMISSGWRCSGAITLWKKLSVSGSKIPQRCCCMKARLYLPTTK